MSNKELRKELRFHKRFGFGMTVLWLTTLAYTAHKLWFLELLMGDM